MKPIEFPEQNTVFAKDQPEYQPLPALVDKQQVISCWELSDDEIKTILETKKIWLSLMTYGYPLQPIYITTNKSDVIFTSDIQ